MWRIFKLFTLVLCLTWVTLIGCKKKSTETEIKITVTLVNEEKEAGRCVVLWIQQDDKGSPVPEGIYHARMTAGDFQGEDEFQILSNASHVPSPCDSSYRGVSGGQLPQSFSISVNSNTYALADTICIYYDLPVSSTVTVRVESAN